MASTKRTRTSSSADELLPLLTPRLPQVADRRGRSAASTVGLFERIQRGEAERRSFRERRASPRAAVGVAIETEAGGTRVMAQTYDLSTFGLAVRGGPTPRKGRVVALRLFLPDDPATPLALRAVVLGPFDAKGGVRMKFVEPPLEAIRRIHRLVA